MPLTIESLARLRLPSRVPEGPLAHAVGELARLAPPATGGGAGGDLRLEAADLPGDGFRVDVSTNAVAIAGRPRGILNSAYWLLEQLGFTWVAPGPEGERFTPGKSLPDGTYESAPAFARRTLILGQDALHDDWRDWLEWASRNRLNDIFFHDTPPSRLNRGGDSRPGDAEGTAADGRGWMFERWDADGADIVAEARSRGMTIQFGGHHLPALVSRELFEAHSDWFPLRRGRRDQRYNLCVSNPEAVAHLQQEARAFFQRFAGADTYHLWADDIPGGGWCECSACEDLSPSDQALLATNLVAEELARAAPDARIAHLAYHDTLGHPRIQPAANVNMLWAPRERCYAHSIGDPSCARNRDDYWKPLQDLLPVFANKAGRTNVFEYYSDSILFKWLAPPLLAVLPADARHYRDAGAGNLQNLMVTPRPWLGPPWHAWWMARCAWDADSDATVSLAMFCEAAYGSAAAAAMIDYYREQEAAYALVLERHDLQPMSRHDVLDYSDTPRETMRRKAVELLESEGTFKAAMDALPDGAGWLKAEAAQAELTWHVVAHLAHRVAAWDARLSDDAAAVGRHLPESFGHLEWLERWEEETNSPAFANLSRPMLRAMRFHTSQIG